MTRARGTVILKSTVHDLASMDTAQVVNEIAVVGSRCSRFEPALRLLRAGRIRESDMISARLPLAEAPRAFELAAKGALRVLLMPNGDRQNHNHKIHEIHKKCRKTKDPWHFCLLHLGPLALTIQRLITVQTPLLSRFIGFVCFVVYRGTQFFSAAMTVITRIVPRKATKSATAFQLPKLMVYPKPKRFSTKMHGSSRLT